MSVTETAVMYPDTFGAPAMLSRGAGWARGIAPSPPRLNKDVDRAKRFYGNLGWVEAAKMQRQRKPPPY